MLGIFLRRIVVTALLAVGFISLLPAPAQEKASKVSAALQPFVDKGTLAGAVVLVADKEKVLALEAIGYADVASKRPMIVDMLFWIASMTKPMTAAALMMLVDQGKVNLDDPVEKYLPEFKGQRVIEKQDKDRLVLKKPKRPVRVRDVLTHSSGMPFRSAMEIPTIDVLTLRDATRSYALTPLNTEPGTKFLYSNAGINTAGRIIEVVSGMPYEDFMDKRLFGPLGMKDTTFWPSEAQLKRLAATHKPGKGKVGLETMTIAPLAYPLSDRKRQPCPAGGLFSTARDTGRFCQMMLRGGEFAGKRLLSEKAVEQMAMLQVEKGVTAKRGLGFALGNDGSYGHGGAYATNMTIHPKSGIVTVYMVQHSGFPGNGNQSGGAFMKAATAMYGK